MAGNYYKEVEEVREAVARFPAEFGLKAYPGMRFRISPTDSYHDGILPVLYVHVLNGDMVWRSFAKGSEIELRRELRPVPTVKNGEATGEFEQGQMVTCDRCARQFLARFGFCICRG